jgi:two-component system sensor histidine kinase GlrK
MERSIRQFQVLNEAELFIAYKEHRNKFLIELESLEMKELNPSLHKQLETLQQQEQRLYQHILLNSQFDQFNQLMLTKTDLDPFDQLTSLARLLLSDGEKRMGIEASNLSIIATNVQQRLVYTALASIPLALLLALIFVHFLTRPIKDIGRAIRNLGEVGFEQPIYIKGPNDLTKLGLHLEWLRQKLNRVEYEKQQFIRNVSHELKTPLATLKEGTDLLSENVVGELNTEQQEIIQLMKIGNITINDLVENLLDYL